MITAPHHAINLSDESDVLDLVKDALKKQLSLVAFKQDLRRAADKLHDLCVEFAELGLDEEFEEHYLNLFDACSHLTAATRGRSVIALGLHRAAECLEKNFLIPH